MEGSIMWIASANCAHFFSNSEAALEPVEMQRDSPFLLDNALNTARYAHAKLLPITYKDQFGGRLTSTSAF